MQEALKYLTKSDYDLIDPQEDLKQKKLARSYHNILYSCAASLSVYFLLFVYTLAGYYVPARYLYTISIASLLMSFTIYLVTCHTKT